MPKLTGKKSDSHKGGLAGDKGRAEKLTTEQRLENAKKQRKNTPEEHSVNKHIDKITQWVFCNSTSRLISIILSLFTLSIFCCKQKELRVESLKYYEEANMIDLIKELEMRVAAKRKELEDEERALETVRRMIKEPSNVQSPSIAPKAQIEAIKFEDLLDSVEKIKKHTLGDDVRNVVSQFGDHEFTVAHIHAALNRIGVVVDAKSPRARIGIVLAKLLEEGFVVRVAEGGGNVPHRYQLNEAHD